MATPPLLPSSHSRRRPDSSHPACPHCGSREIHRSHAHGIIERHIVRAFRFYPYRCELCERRFYIHLSSNELH